MFSVNFSALVKLGYWDKILSISFDIIITATIFSITMRMNENDPHVSHSFAIFFQLLCNGMQKNLEEDLYIFRNAHYSLPLMLHCIMLLSTKLLIPQWRLPNVSKPSFHQGVALVLVPLNDWLLWHCHISYWCFAFHSELLHCSHREDQQL